jgi:hypothetical protein
MGSTLCIRTAIIERPLAYQMRRLGAARASESGLQILTLPQMAARLAGGFAYPVTAEQMEPGIQAALDEGGFAELDHVRQLPGMTRAVARALRKAWDADIDLAEIEGERVRDLALIEARMKARFPSAARTPRDIRNAALARVDHAATFGVGADRTAVLCGNRVAATLECTLSCGGGRVGSTKRRRYRLVRGCRRAARQV